MILPTKRLTADRALLTIGAEILSALANDQYTVSQTWMNIHDRRVENTTLAPITYDWFVLALDLLFAINAITWSQGRLSRRTVL